VLAEIAKAPLSLRVRFRPVQVEIDKISYTCNEG